MSVLQQILETARADLAEARKALPLRDVEDQAREQSAWRAPVDVRESLRGPRLAVISEVKRRSPSVGHLAEIADPASLAAVYAQAGAAMISVLTEPHRFGGSMDDLVRVRSGVGTPLLRKDFIVDPYQIAQARAAGADCILLIVAALSDAALAELLACAGGWGMQALVEAHDESEVERALAADAAIIGVNSRNLKTLDVDPSTFARLSPLIPDEVVRVAESGIVHKSDAMDVATAGADAILVGQALVQSDDPAGLIAEFTSIEKRRA